MLEICGALAAAVVLAFAFVLRSVRVSLVAAGGRHREEAFKRNRDFESEGKTRR